MSIAAALSLGLLIGAVLGALGGGGAILTVPLLVYALGQSAQDATTSSLVIVGLTAVVAALGYTRAHHVRWGTAVAFGATGLAAAYAGTALNHRIDEHTLLVGFAALMIMAGIAMLRKAHTDTRVPAAPAPVGSEDPSPSQNRRPAPGGTTAAGCATVQLTPIVPGPTLLRERLLRNGKIVVAGLGVGFLTGIFGVGGGFIIVPALVLVLRMAMPTAVGTSLLIIAFNSASSLAARTGTAHFDWAIIVPFTVAAMAGTYAGRKIADRLPATILNRAFAILLLLVAAYVGAHNLFALT